MEPNWIDRLALAVSPGWGRKRIAHRAAATAMARHYEAASNGRRTQNWNRSAADPNVAAGPSLAPLRAISRDLVRNNAWARNGRRVVVDNTVGWGISAKPLGPAAAAADAIWRQWAEATTADADGRLDFAGIQALSMGTIFESGEVLLRRRPRRIEDGLPLPLQIQVLEPDFLDTTKDAMTSQAGGPIVNGVELDKLGRRVAYWLFDQHPGSAAVGTFGSTRVPASEIIHAFELLRPGQIRGVPWLCAAIVNLRDFDEYEDASLMRAKIAACFAGFITDIDGAGAAIGEQSADDELVDTLQPGMMPRLKPGQDIKFSTPPITPDDGFSERTLRRIAASVGVTYEDMTGDYSQVNFSSARMGRIKHWGHVNSWRWQMLIPQVCNGVWRWAMEAAAIAGKVPEVPRAEWTPPPMPMIEPDKEGLALTRLVRAGAMTFDEMARERGYDPEKHWAAYSAELKKLDSLGIVLDSDVRKTSQAGLTQERVGGGSKKAPAEEVPAEE